MSRRSAKGAGPKDRATRPNASDPSALGFYTPFEKLVQQLPQIVRDDSRRPPPPPPPPPVQQPEIADEDKLAFSRAMAGVVPLPDTGRTKIPLPSAAKKGPRFLAREEAEAMAQLVDLVAGTGRFELSWSDEYIDGAVTGISPRILKKLREGYFSYQDYIDLHGLNRVQAQQLVTEFILESYAANRRCVLIISGRGLNSKDRQPVLKTGLVAWLMHAPLKRLVLAFASARSYDGGSGAFYILLRKNEPKSHLVTPAR